MLWFQYWGENIPSFTEFRLFYKKKTVRVVNKSSYQQTFFKLKLIIKPLFQNWLQNAILVHILVVYRELTKYHFAEGALFNLIAAPTIKSGPHKLGPVEPGGCEAVKCSSLFEIVFG